MLGIPSGTVLIKSLFRFGDTVFGAFSDRSQKCKVILGSESIWENNSLTTHTLGKLHRACRHIGFRIDMDIQAAGGVTDIADNDRFRRANHTIEPHLGVFRQSALGVRHIACQRRSLLQHKVSKPNRAGAIGKGRFYRNTHNTHILLFVYDLCQSDKNGISHQAPISSHKDDLPIPWLQNPAAARGL